MRLFCWLLIVILHPYMGFTQKSSIYTPSYRHYTINDGLVASQVMSIFQDSREFIWIGTKGGISKFNGVRFENFYFNDSIPIGQVNYLMEDVEKNIWAFSSGGLAYYDGIKWTRKSRMDLRWVKLIDGHIMGINVMDSTVYNVTDKNILPLKKFKPIDFQINEIVAQIPNLFYFNTSNGNTINSYQYSEEYGLKHVGTIDPNAIITYLKSNDSFYIKFENFESTHAALTYKWDQYKWRAFSLPNIRPSHYYSVHYAINGTNEILAINNIVYKLKQDQSGYDKIAELNSSLQQVMIAKDQSIWLGAENGIYQTFPMPFKYISDELIPQPWSIVEGEADEYYISCFNFGLKKIDANNIFEVDIPLTVFNNINPKGFYMGSTKDQSGNLYFPHDAYAIIKTKNKDWSSVKDYGFVNKSFGSTSLISYYDSIGQKLLLGMNKGVIVYDIKLKKIQNIPLDSICNGFVLTIDRDQENNYWFGACDLIKYHIPTGTISPFSSQNKKLPFKGIVSLKVDTHNGMWISGQRSGFYFKFPTGDSIIPVAPEVITKKIDNLIQVDSFLVASGLQGLFLINLNEFYRTGKFAIKNYNQYNGFSGIEPSQNSCYLDSKRNYWVCCANGVFTTHSSNFNTIAYPSNVRIYQINDKRVSYDTSTTIQLNKNENQLTVRFESIGFQRTTIPQFSWRLNGYEVEWSDWTEDQIAFYSNLPSKEYTFEVRSRHPGSEAESAQATDGYSFKVTNDFYKEPHFYKYTLIGGILFGLTFLGLTRSIRSNQRAARDAKNLAEKREHLMKYYQIQSLQAQLNPHFIFNLLSTIQGYISHDMKDKAKEYLQRLSKLMRRFLDSSVSSDLQNMLLSNQDISLEKEIELLTYYIELEQSLHEGKFEFVIEVEPELNTDDIYIPPMMIQPFVENAIKHGLVPLKEVRPGFLAITFKKVNEEIQCQIEDNGLGFDVNNSATKKDQVRSHGVKLVMERANLLSDFGFKIEINTDSTPNIGTRVTIRFSDNTT